MKIEAALSGAGVLFIAQPSALFACAACYGQSDSPMAKGMNWGILSLLAIVVVVLGGIAGFFVFIARRSALPSHQTTLSNQPVSVTSH